MLESKPHTSTDDPLDRHQAHGGEGELGKELDKRIISSVRTDRLTDAAKPMARCSSW